MKMKFSVKTKLIFLICFLIVNNIFAQPEEALLKIHYLGHSSFLLQFDNGIDVVTDFGNYHPWGMGSIIHDFGGLVPTIMTYSHTHHLDHYDADRIPDGVQYILTEQDSLEIEGLKITPIRVCESNLETEDNSAYLFNYKGFEFLHLGDAQIQIMNIENEEVKQLIQNIIPDSLDMLFMTIEGVEQFIPQAELFVDLVKPKRIIPMHHWSESYLNNFLSYLESQNSQGKNYEIIDSSISKYEIIDNDFPAPVKVIKLSRSPFVYTVQDYDGNIYETVKIGKQVWLKENLKSLHYSDGTEIAGTVAYDNDEQNVDIYGRLYNWDATMRNSTIEAVQGISPDGWHIPTDNEWTELENYLGGADIAGGKMKEAGNEHWDAPNTGADNSSGFTILPAGEFDASSNPTKFWLLNTHAIFWSSSESTESTAIQRDYAYNSATSNKRAWQKAMKYSVRCIKNRSFYGFSFDVPKGHVPHTVQFVDNSDPSLFIHSWEWDFDNDGEIDSYEQNPQWTYNESGVFKPTVKFISDSKAKTITHEDSIIVFDGESSLIFSNKKSIVKVSPNEQLILSDCWTVEAWIKPTDLHGKYVIDKNSISIYTNKSSTGANKNSLVIRFSQEDGSQIRVSSEDSSLTSDNWQNIAVVYDYNNKILECYINGNKQKLNYDPNIVFNSQIKSNLEDTLYIANRKAIPRSFEGNIDEIRIWNTALSEDQLNVNRYQYLTGNEENLLAYWKLNEGNGEIIFDNSSYENNGTIINAEYDWGIDYTCLVEVEEIDVITSLPTKYSLEQNYPNPFNPNTIIKFSIPSNVNRETKNVKIVIYDILGRKLKTLVNEPKQSGIFSVTFDASKLSSGVYYYQMTTNDFYQTKKMLLQK